MPLVVICGRPATGKTCHALRLQEYLTSRGKAVSLINEEGFSVDKATAYATSGAEKSLRGLLKSAVERELDCEKVVVLDSSNYIKGYRYELFCLARTVRTPQVTVFIDTPIDLARNWNTVYPSDVFEGLSSRMEQPNPKNRWDSPLFQVKPGEDLQFEAIYEALFGDLRMRKAISTKTEEKVGENYLYTVDSATSEIVERVLSAQDEGRNHLEVQGEQLSLEPHYSVVELKKARQQFLKLTRMHPCPNDAVSQAFLSYIATTRSSF